MLDRAWWSETSVAATQSAHDAAQLGQPDHSGQQQVGAGAGWTGESRQTKRAGRRVSWDAGGMQGREDRQHHQRGADARDGEPHQEQSHLWAEDRDPGSSTAESVAPTR